MNRELTKLRNEMTAYQRASMPSFFCSAIVPVNSVLQLPFPSSYLLLILAHSVHRQYRSATSVPLELPEHYFARSLLLKSGFVLEPVPVPNFTSSAASQSDSASSLGSSTKAAPPPPPPSAPAFSSRSSSSSLSSTTFAPSPFAHALATLAPDSTLRTPELHFDPSWHQLVTSHLDPVHDATLLRETQELMQGHGLDDEDDDEFGLGTFGAETSISPHANRVSGSVGSTGTGHACGVAGNALASRAAVDQSLLAPFYARLRGATAPAGFSAFAFTDQVLSISVVCFFCAFFCLSSCFCLLLGLAYFPSL